MKYSLQCTTGHTPETITVEAANDDEAMNMMMAKSGAHVSSKHPEIKMTEDETRSFITSNWTKS